MKPSCLWRNFNANRGTSPSLPGRSLPQRYSAIPPPLSGGTGWKNADRPCSFDTRPLGVSGGGLALAVGVIRWFLAF
nr:MAG TPA: hypothetical protein [Caudoviricetes sp.]